jgi:uncharacterized protein with NRDE domain
VVAANRDEFYRRPTQPAAFWSDQPHLLAGRDLEKGGTWMGVTTTGRFAALTNYRDPSARKSSAPSRGLLVSGFLASTASPHDYLVTLSADLDRYEGFNLVVGDGNAFSISAAVTIGHKRYAGHLRRVQPRDGYAVA